MSSPSARNASFLVKALSDPLRLDVLHRLIEGPATVSEIVATTGASQPNVSNHLAVLRDKRLVTTTRAARQVTYSLDDPAVAQLVEVLYALSGAAVASSRTTPAIATARTCYDHLAGKLGVGLLKALVDLQILRDPERRRGEISLAPGGGAFFAELGVDVASARTARRRFAYACLDWTERRPHLGGSLGAAVCRMFLDRGWVKRDAGSRAVFLGVSGQRALKRHFRLSFPAADQQQAA